MMKSPIGLDTAQSQVLAAELNKLLASYQILYMNVRGFHWNIRGNQFFELHLKFAAESRYPGRADPDTG